MLVKLEKRAEWMKPNVTLHWGCGRTMVLHERLHLFLDALVPLGDVDVQRVVAAGLAVGPFAPLLEGRDEADARLGNHMVDWVHTHTHTGRQTQTYP